MYFLSSGGLQNTGSSNGMCSSSEGQVYGRGADVDGMFAIMYAWYMPKDQPLEGSTGPVFGMVWYGTVWGVIPYHTM
jgi:hypothetical protein